MDQTGRAGVVAPSSASAGLPHAGRVRVVEPARVFRWLAAGWSDMRAGGWVSPAYGLMFVALGAAMTAGLAWAGMSYLIAPMIGAFLLIAPLLALGLYRVSWDVERGVRPRFGRALMAWRRNPYHILTAGLILMLFVMIWARMNVIAFALFFPYQSMSLASLVAQAATVDGMVFVLFVTALGLGFATVAFISNVTALPMMLERREDIFAAVLVSVLAVSRNPRTMVLWAAVIVLVTGAGLLTGIGLVVALPLIGHASWHAYRDLVAGDAAT